MPLMIKGFKKDVIKFAIITCRKPPEWWNVLNGSKKFGYPIKPCVPPPCYLIDCFQMIEERKGERGWGGYSISWCGNTNIRHRCPNPTFFFFFKFMDWNWNKSCNLLGFWYMYNKREL